MKTRFYLLAFPLLALAALAALPALASTPIDKSVTVTPDGNVSVANVAGEVKVIVWNQNKVHIGGTLGKEAKRLAVEKSADGVDIRVILYDGSTHCSSSPFGERCTHLVIKLPATSHLRVHTVSADISADGLTGPVKLQSVSGDISLASKSADISSKSVSGDITLDGSAPQAQVSAHSISGDVKVRNVGGRLSAQSVSGDLMVNAAHPLTGAELQTTSGDIHLQAALAGKGDYDIQSTSGDVELALPKVPDARIDVSSLSGEIDTNFGPKPRRTSKYGPGREWQFSPGSSNSQIDINTTSGDISIHADHT